MARRVDRDGALLILGVGEWAFRSYGRTDPTFPKPGPRNGTWAVSELKAWKAAQEKPARGSVKGQAKPKDPDGYACDSCGTKVPRRWVDRGSRKKVKPKLCKPCLFAADLARQEKRAKPDARLRAADSPMSVLLPAVRDLQDHLRADGEAGEGK